MALYKIPASIPRIVVHRKVLNIKIVQVIFREVTKCLVGLILEFIDHNVSEPTRYHIANLHEIICFSE